MREILFLTLFILASYTMNAQVKNSNKVDEKYQIPTLNEVFDLVDKKCLINIELKGLGTPSKVVTLIEEYISEKNWNYNHFIISSFDWDMLQETSNLNPNIPIGVLTEENIDTALAFAETIPAVTVEVKL